MALAARLGVRERARTNLFSPMSAAFPVLGVTRLPIRSNLHPYVQARKTFLPPFINVELTQDKRHPKRSRESHESTRRSGFGRLRLFCRRRRRHVGSRFSLLTNESKLRLVMRRIRELEGMADRCGGAAPLPNPLLKGEGAGGFMQV